MTLNDLNRSKWAWGLSANERVRKSGSIGRWTLTSTIIFGKQLFERVFFYGRLLFSLRLQPQMGILNPEIVQPLGHCDEVGSLGFEL